MLIFSNPAVLFATVNALTLSNLVKILIEWVPEFLPFMILALILSRIFGNKFWSVYGWVPCVIVTLFSTAVTVI